MKPPDHQLARFLQGVRESREPNDDDTRRIRAALERRLPAGAFPTSNRRASSIPGSARSARKTARTAGLLGALSPLGAAAKLGTAKVVVGALIVTGAATGTTWMVVHGTTEPTHEVKVTPGPTAARRLETLEPVAEATPLARAPGVAPSAEAPPPVTEPRASGQASVAPPTSSLGDEVLLLRQAESARKSGDPSTCLRMLSEMERHFPRSSLTEERLALTVWARCDLGQTDAATAAADRLKRNYPTTVHAERLRSSCVSATARFEDE